MERMYSPYLDLVEKCIDFAKRFLLLPEEINIYFEDCPSNRFPTMMNAAESDENGNLWFNKSWLTGEDRWNNHKDDIEFFVFHELRHMHQFCSIYSYLDNKAVNEEAETILGWKAGFENYIRNVGGESQNVNLAQEVEIDANAYAALLANLYHLGEDIKLNFSVPAEAMDVAMERVKVYQNKREIQSYLNEVYQKQLAEQQRRALTMKNTPVRKQKIGRNEPCPCGSGLKYKKCKCKKYHV